MRLRTGSTAGASCVNPTLYARKDSPPFELWVHLALAAMQRGETAEEFKVVAVVSALAERFVDFISRHTT